MRIEFSDQVVLVTGATRGIGKQIAEDFAQAGAEVLILTGTKEEEIRALNESAETAGGSIRHYYCVDFTDPQSTERFLENIREFERIDVCINNAGINRIDYISETLVSDWDAILEVNLKAPFLILREVSRAMKENQYGRIVNIASIFGVISREKRAIYSSSKFGLRGLTVAVSNELARYNVLVNSVSPGFVLTDLTKHILRQEEMKELAAQIPVGRLAGPEEISRVVLFLSSSLNSYITGKNIIVDGGYVDV